MRKYLSIILLAFPFFWMGCNKDEGIAPDCIDPDQVDNNTGCIELWDPVCGCNDITYSNECFARAAGVTSWTQGTCGD